MISMICVIKDVFAGGMKSVGYNVALVQNICNTNGMLGARLLATEDNLEKRLVVNL